MQCFLFHLMLKWWKFSRDLGSHLVLAIKYEEKKFLFLKGQYVAFTPLIEWTSFAFHSVVFIAIYFVVLTVPVFCHSDHLSSVK